MRNEKENPTAAGLTAMPQRRRFMFDGLALTLSGAAVGLLAGRPELLRSAAAGAHEVEKDVRILNSALNAEREAIAAYQVGAESGLLEKPVLDVAVQFQGHHKEHADLLATTIRELGGEAGDTPEFDFPTDQLKNQTDVLKFAAGLERGAVSAYAGAIPLFDNRDLSKAAASILADEAMHWAILRQALGMDPVPGAFFS